MNNEKTGAFIRELRKEKEMTQKDLADKLHLTDRAVSKWERGLSAPDLASLEPLAEILGVSVGELLAGERSWGEKPEEAAKEEIKNVLQYSREEVQHTTRKLRKHALLGGTLLLVVAGFVLFGLWWNGVFDVADRVSSPDGSMTVTVYDRDILIEPFRRDGAITVIMRGRHQYRSVYSGEYQEFRELVWAPDSRKYVLALDTSEGIRLILTNLESSSSSNLTAILEGSVANEAHDGVNTKVSYDFLQWSRDSKSILIYYVIEDTSQVLQDGYFWYRLSDGETDAFWQMQE